MRCRNAYISRLLQRPIGSARVAMNYENQAVISRFGQATATTMIAASANNAVITITRCVVMTGSLFQVQTNYSLI